MRTYFKLLSILLIGTLLSATALAQQPVKQEKNNPVSAVTTSSITGSQKASDKSGE